MPVDFFSTEISHSQPQIGVLVRPSTLTPASASAETEGAARKPGAFALSAARLLLGITLLAAPLAFGAVDAWSWASLAVLSALLLLLWTTGCVQQGVLKIVWSPLYLPAALFLLLAAVQFLGRLTRDPAATHESFLKLVTDIIFFFLAGQLFTRNSDKAWRAVGLTALVYTFSLSLFAIVQFFSSQGLIYWSVKPRWGGWVFGPYVNHNHYAGLMEMLIPIAAGYAFSRPHKHSLRALLGFAVLMPVASVLLSGSRGGFLALLAESSILLAILFASAAGHGRRALAPAVALAITAAGLVFFWMDPGDISKRLATLFNPSGFTEKTLGERKVVALDSFHIFRDHPWTGVGLGGFETAYPPYQSFPSDEVWDHAHNDYAEALAETGLAGGLLILAAIILFFRLAFRGLGERLKHPAGWTQLGAALGCCGLLIHSLADFNLHIPANALWFGVCLAWATL